jgi:hypothetical protein
MMNGLTAFQIKLFAALLMVIDHAGRLLFNDLTVMLALGRFSFPLFAWLAIQGEKHTQNFRNYVIRLIVVGLITQPIYSYFFIEMERESLEWLLRWDNWQWNMLFALAYGVTVVRYCKRQEDWILQFTLASVCAIGAQLLHLEGGYVTTMSIYAMSLLETAPWAGLGLFALVHLLYGLNIELLAIGGALIPRLYNGVQGPKAKWFYAVYPVHFVLLLILAQSGFGREALAAIDQAWLIQWVDRGIELINRLA